MRTPDTDYTTRTAATLLIAAGMLAATACHKEYCEKLDSTGGSDEAPISFYDRSLTKGSSISSADMEHVFGVQGIDIKALRGSDDYFRSEEKLFCLGPGQWATSESYHWPSDAGDALNFWAWAFDKQCGGEISDVAANSDSLRFHFKMTEPADDGMDAIRQNELLVGACLGATRSNSANGVGLDFHHALSAIKINVGRANAGCLRSITLSNIYREADCTVSGADGGTGADGKAGIAGIAWSNHSTLSDYRQDFNLEIQGDLEDGYYQDVSTSEQGEKDGTIFMVIPQKLEGASIKVDYKQDGKDFSEIFENALPGQWEPGRTYIYSLSILGGLSICIDGEFTSTTAVNVGFTNDGECPCYLRATMVGTWDNADGEIIKPASGEDNEVVRDPRWNEFWFFDPESHIYYYRYPLRGGESVAVKLFDSFRSASGPAGTSLNMTVMVQAIKQDNKLNNVRQAIGEANGYVSMLYTDFYEGN